MYKLWFLIPWTLFTLGNTKKFLEIYEEYYEKVVD